MQTPVLCSACRNEVVITDHECGEIVCSRCGIVIDRLEISPTQEWRAFNVDEFYRRSRVGGAVSLSRFNKGLLTTIGSDKDHKVNGMNFDRIRVWDFRIQTANDRSLKQAIPELDHLRESLGLTETIVEKSAYFYRKASKMNLIKEGLYLLCLLTQCILPAREMETPRTLNKYQLPAMFNGKKSQGTIGFSCILLTPRFQQ